jgi:predicted ester cyclase
VIAEDDKVVTRTTPRSTHLGMCMGILSTGWLFVQEQIHTLRFVDGKAVEHRAARAYALESIAYYDSMVACWDAKYSC